MNDKHIVDVGVQDFSTLLVGLAGQLRCDALAVTGMAHMDGDVEDDETRTLMELDGSLDRVALLLDAIRPRLCHACQMIEIGEQWVFRAPRAGCRQ